MPITRLNGERTLFDTIPFERERIAVDAEQMGRELTASLHSRPESVDLATRFIHASPLFAGHVDQVQPALFSDPTFHHFNR